MRQIEHADAYTGSFRYVRRQRPKPQRTLLGSERPAPYRGIVQGRTRTAWGDSTGHCVVHDVIPGHGTASSAYGVWREAVYGSTVPDVLAMPKGRQETDVAIATPKVDFLIGAMQRAQVRDAVRRYKRVR